MKVLVYDIINRRSIYFDNIPNNARIGITSSDIELFCHNYSHNKTREINNVEEYITNELKLSFHYKIGDLTREQTREILSQFKHIYDKHDIKLRDGDSTDIILREIWPCSWCLIKD